jgi:non-specific serine/threonine protein kinase/serine/threonine-protein kinase
MPTRRHESWSGAERAQNNFWPAFRADFALHTGSRIKDRPMISAAPGEKSIFLEAIELTSAEERSCYLHRACGGDPSLLAQIEALLRAHEGTVALLDVPQPAERAIESRPIREGTGTRIGPYTLLEQIGEGGMGVVYLAEQTLPMRRKVALKIIKPGMDTKQVVARFEAERQALAMMDHPNIASVHDGGATESGRPYFVMELVCGIPITDYCDRERLSITDRLDLFVLVCRAVQHAHQKGIIHRDLKPSNILVTVIDGAAVPKIIDFGVAKATGHSLTERTLHTGFAQLVGTPLYMSPEQVELSGVDVDTRSDIYSLGVLLYELLTGTTPFDEETFRKAAFDEMRRIIREEEPPTPSTRLSGLSRSHAPREDSVTETVTTIVKSVATQRRTQPAKLTKLIRGELDWIVMKALEKDRKRRYETPNDFADDVMRYLTDQPVEACPPSVSYRFARYARRNRVALTAAVMVATALISGTGASLWQAAQARRAQRKAEAAEARAANEAAIARAVNEFLQDDLLGKAPEGRPNLTVKEALDRASSGISSRFRDQPLVEAAIRTTIGTSYSQLQQHRAAVPHLERAVALRKLHLGADHQDTLGAMEHLGGAYFSLGRWSEAIPIRIHMLEVWMAALGPDHAETLACATGLAYGFRFVGRWDVSVRLLEDVIERARTVCGPAHDITLGAMHYLAMNYADMGRLAESLALYERIVQLNEAANGGRHRLDLWTLMTYAQACQRAGELDRAERILQEVSELQSKREDSRSRRLGIANARGWLAVNRLLREKYGEAEPLAREAVAAFGTERGDDARYFYWISVHGAALCGLGRYAEAEPLLLRGYEGQKEREAIMPAPALRLLTEAGQRVVLFYKLTQQPEEAQAWLERIEVARARE